MNIKIRNKQESILSCSLEMFIHIAGIVLLMTDCDKLWLKVCTVILGYILLRTDINITDNN